MGATTSALCGRTVASVVLVEAHTTRIWGSVKCDESSPIALYAKSGATDNFFDDEAGGKMTTRKFCRELRRI